MKRDANHFLVKNSTFPSLKNLSFFENLTTFVAVDKPIKLIMKHLDLKTLALACIVAISLTACNGLGKMVKNAGKVSYTVTPDPIEMHGDSIAVTVNVKYPEKFFAKKAVLTVTPVIKYEGGEKELRAEKLKGEKAEGDGKTISYTGGGSLSYTDKVAYQKGMEVATLEVKATGAVKSKTKEFPAMKIADGTIITPLLVKNDERPILGKDAFVKVIPRSVEGEIHYLVNQSNVRPAEMNDADIKAMREFVKDGVSKEFTFKSLNVSAYASPDGEQTLNANLAESRAKTGLSAIEGILLKNKIAEAKEEGFYNTETTAEDWEGFKRLMEQSDIADKELILRVLTMYSDLDQREKEIKNLAATYVEVSEKILPSLRRAKLTLNAEENARTDEEIQTLLASTPDSLSVEEILYAATLTDDINKKLEIYQIAEKVYPADWRSSNNVGYIYLLQNKVNDAQAQFEKADAASADNPIVKNNLGICARWKGDRAKAAELYEAAAGAGPEVNYNKGIVNILDGDYAAATANFAGSGNSFNMALASVLNGSPDAALSILDASDESDEALSYYLKAVAGARTGKKDVIVNNLKSAIQKDASYAEKASKDAEFIKYREDS